MGYSRAILKGVGWIAAVRVVTRILSFIKTLIIARALSPDDFGLFGIATLVLTFVEIFTETGVNIFLTQEKEDIDKYINTAWIVSIVRGVLISVVIAASAPLISIFFNASKALPLLLLISLVPLARGFINPSIVKFITEMLFHKEFYYRTTLLLVEVVVSCILVFLTHNAISLVSGLLVSVVVEIYLSFAIISPRPHLIFEKQLFSRIIGYGKWITASTIFNYFYQHGDDIAVGRILGTGALGIYDMAYRISLIPLSDISNVVTKVTFPVYVKLADDRKRFLRAFLHTFAAIGGLTIPIGLILFFFPKEIISLLLGEKWSSAVPVLRVLAIFGIVRALSAYLNFIFLTIGKQQIFTLVTLFGLLGLGVGIIPLIHLYGIVGAGLAALLGTTLTIPIMIIFYYRTFLIKRKGPSLV